MRPTLTTLLLLILGAHSLHAVEQQRIPRIDQMPDAPTPWALRDWKQVARDYDALVFDSTRQGQYLPILWTDRTHINLPRETFGLPAYVGHPIQNGDNRYDVITCLGALLSATLIGIDKTNQHGQDWIAMSAAWFNSRNGENLYLNNVPGSTGQTFWYELFPSLLFYRIADRYRSNPDFPAQMRATADQIHRMTVALAAPSTDLAAAVPNFDLTAFNFLKLQPFSNGIWKEPDGAAAAAWLQYIAYIQLKDPRYLAGARACLRFLNERPQNPFYEILQPYGAYVAARMNAELGDKHDTSKLLNWVFDGTNPRRWGVSAGNWGDLDASGLLASVIEHQGYAFAMNTFDAISVLAPIIRYDPRFAADLAKWITLAANNSRLFYRTGLPDHQQTCAVWSRRYDPTACIAYEGVREEGLARCRAVAETTSQGRIVQGDFHATFGENQIMESLEPNDAGMLDHAWRINLPGGHNAVVVMVTKFEIPAGAPAPQLEIRCRTSPGQAPRHLVNLNPANKTHWAEFPISTGTVEVILGGTLPKGARIVIDDLYIQLPLGIKPYAQGDPMFLNWAPLDLGLYGSSFVGCMAAVVERTNVNGIARIDATATDAWAASAYPTFAYFNPHASTQTLAIEVGPNPVDLYDALRHEFVARAAQGTVRLDIQAKTTRLLVHTPAGGKLTFDGWRTKLNDVVIDYANARAPRPDYQ